jgi:hypothetical protein
MEEIYKKVLEHANIDIGEEGEVKVADLIDYLNNKTELVFPKNSIAIYTIIRHAYNFYMSQKLIKEAEKIVKTYSPEGYVWKVLNKYKK